jgi:DNA-binding NtrC family response regulator
MTDGIDEAGPAAEGAGTLAPTEGRRRAAVVVVECGQGIATRLRHSGYEVRSAGTHDEVLQRLEDFKPDAFVLEGDSRTLEPLNFIRGLLEIEPRSRIVVVAEPAGLELAVAAMKAGACDVVAKPFSLPKLEVALERLVADRSQSEAPVEIGGQDVQWGSLERLIGDCGLMRQLRASIGKVIAGDRRLRDNHPPAVLVTGETGTGKELVARALHYEGPRRDEPFVEINCASIPAQLLESELFGHERGAFTDAKTRKLGLVETAHRGTLFLDEIGDMDLALQAKLLRLLEERTVRRVGGLRDQTVDVRIVAATHRPLEALLAEGRFRADLFFRIRTVHLAIPSLRDRGDDILRLANHYLALHARRYGREDMALSAGSRGALLHHRWPGNVRELRNVMEQAVLMAGSDIVEIADLGWMPTLESKSHASTEAASAPTLEQLERDALQTALRSSRWNVSRAARLLGISRDTLRYRIEKYGLSVMD